MVCRLFFLFFCGNIALSLGNAQKLPRVKRQSLKVHINATGDAVCMRYIRPSPSVRLEGFILGYGSSFFSNQYIPLPSDGKPYITEVDAEPRYLIAVRPAPVPNYRKSCSGKTKTPKPLQLVIGTLTPTSVFLSWGVLVNPKHDWTTMNNCANDRFYTVRYREKDKNKIWTLQLCPTTETVVDHLKPNRVYEFGVKDNTDNGVWSKIYSHSTAESYKNKENGLLQNNYKLPKIQTQFISVDPKAQVPVAVIREVIQNITHRTQSKTAEKSPLAGPILVHLFFPDFNRTKLKQPAPFSEDMSETAKKISAENETHEWPAESKTSEIQEISPQSGPVTTELDGEMSKPTLSSVSEELASFPAHTESELESSKPRVNPMAELPLDTLAPHKFPELPKIKVPPTVQMPRETLASREMQPDLLQLQTTAPKTTQKKPAVTNEPIPEFLTPKTSKPLDWPRATLAPSETPLTPLKWKTPTTPEGLFVKPASESPPLEQDTPKTSRITEQLKTTPASEPPPLEQDTPKTSRITEQLKTTPASEPPPLEQDTPKTSRITEQLKTTPASEPPPLEQDTPKTSRITEQLKTTPALPETTFVPSTPKPAQPPMPEIKPEKEPQWETTTARIYKTPELPKTTLAPSKTKITVSKPQILPHLEEPKTVLAVTTKLVPVPITTKVSHLPGYPVATMASSEPTSIPSQSKESDYTSLKVPDNQLAAAETDTFSYTPSSVSEPPLTNSASSDPTSIPSQSKESDYTSFKVPDNQLASSDPTSIPSQSKESDYTSFKVPDNQLAAAETDTFSPTPSSVSEPPLTNSASSDPTSIPSQSKESDYASFKVPDNQLAAAETDTFSPTPSTVSEPPLTNSVSEPITFNNELPIVEPKVKHHLFSPKTTISPHVLHTKPVPKTVAFRTQPPKTQIEEEDHDPSKPKILFSPDAPQTKPDLEAVTFRPEQPKSTTAPKETRRVPARTKTSASPGITSTKPGSKGSRRVVSRPKTSPSPSTTQTKPAVHQTTSQPLTIKPTMSSGRQKATLAPKETEFIPSKPRTSGKPKITQTKPAPVATFPGSINLHIHVLNGSKDTWVPFKPPSGGTTEGPHLKTASHKVYLTTAKPKMTDKSQIRPGMHKTTPAPGRTRTSGRLTWGDILTDQDITRFYSTSSSASTDVSADSTVAKKKTDSVATPPDPPRPPLAPAKPTAMRRKPLPPNTVTGKPGSSGNTMMPRAPSLATASSIAKPLKPTTLGKTSSPKKPPTASSSPDYSNTTVFSSQPTSETDIAGKPRYIGDHVKYVRKHDDVPCSITDTLQHFPKEEGDNKQAIAPPQNPPTNLTVVTVEGCPSFVVLDWEKPKNDTVTEYKVVSTENGANNEKDKSIITTNQTHSTVENLKPNTSYEFLVIPSNPLGEGPSSDPKPFKTESADPRVNEQISMGKDAIWTEIKFNSDEYSECKGKQFVKRTWYKKFVGVQLCNSLRYKIYLSDSLTGKFYNIGDQRGHGEDHCQFVDSYFDGKTGQQLPPDELPTKEGFFRSFRQEPVKFGKIGAATRANYVHWYECGTTIPGKW